MAMFPTKPSLSQGESPSLYDIDVEDNSISAPSEGGYEFRRNRHTRKRRRVISTGFIGLPHTDYLLLDRFWETHGKTIAFTYQDFIHGMQRQVRFDEFKATYKGIGRNRMWDIKIKMSEI